MAAGTILTGSVASSVCVGLGVPTLGAGALVCGLIVVGVGSYAAGTASGLVGEKVGERIYEMQK